MRRDDKGRRGGAGGLISRQAQEPHSAPGRSDHAANVPTRDLRVTKGHSFLFDTVLLPAEFVVNHRLIEWDDRAQEVTLHHVELDTHDILIANGAPVLTGGPIVDAVWRQLLDRAGARPGLPLTDDPDVHLVVDPNWASAGRMGAACCSTDWMASSNWRSWSRPPHGTVRTIAPPRKAQR